MTNLAGVFLEIARQHAAQSKKQGVGGAQGAKPTQTPSGPSLTAFCPSCARERFLAFEREDAREEYYRCETCGAITRYAVR